MTDTDLVRNVAEECMGWRNVSGAWMDGENWSGFYTNSRQAQEWNPLLYWDHVMIVVSKMREKGWLFKVQPIFTTTNEVPVRRAVEFIFIEDSTRGWGHQSGKSALNDDDTAQRRCILVAALAAVTGGEQ